MTGEELEEIKKIIKPKDKKPIEKKSRCFSLELYPEDNEHCNILDYIISYFNYAYILHDKDKWEQDVIDKDTGEIIHKMGDLKKPHWHVIICFKNPRYIKKLKDELNLKHIETCNFYAYARYLIHKDNPKKYQYELSEIKTNMELRINNAINRDYEQSEQDTRLLYKYIQDKNFVSFRSLTDFAIENDCLSELKKNVYFYKQFCDNGGFFRKVEERNNDIL